MEYKSEKHIIKIIKYSPVIFILILSITISLSLYIDNQNTFKEEKKLIQERYIQDQKTITKNQIQRVHSFIVNKQKKTEEFLKTSIKNRVYEAHSIATNIYEQNKQKGEKVVKKMIQDALRKIRFNNGRGYYFIYSFDYECVLLPVAPSLEGSSFYNFKDGKGEYLTRNIISMLKEKEEGFLTWYYHKPSDMKKQYKKIGFNKHFKPYNWFIGTGEYRADFENDIKKSTLLHIKNIGYKNNNYVFVFDNKGKYLTHPLKDRVGSKMQESRATISKDGKNNSALMFDNFYNIAKEGSGFISYIQTSRPKTLTSAKKTSYIQGFNKWNWIIGKGFYEEDAKKSIELKKEQLSKKVKNDLKKVLVITILLTLLLIFVSLYITKLLDKKFKDYKDEIKEHLAQNDKQHSILSQQSKMAAIGEMIGNIAHQWRQPLSVITTAATGLRLKHELKDLSEEELLRNLDAINNTGQYLSTTIDDFRNFFQSDKEKNVFNISNTIAKALKLVRAQFVNKDILIVEELHQIDICNLENELIQVLVNVLNNARDELLKKETKRYIFINTKVIEDKVFITVKDNAGGVNKEVIEHVFEPYYTTKHKSKGTGIGLYMSEEIIVKHMEGTIEIKNVSFEYEEQSYKGAEVLITLNVFDKKLT